MLTGTLFSLSLTENTWTGAGFTLPNIVENRTFPFVYNPTSKEEKYNRALCSKIQ